MTEPELMKAATKGDVKRVKELVEGGADPCYQDESDGASVLMRAAQAGSLDAVKYLLGKGAPWNALDRAGACAGEYALHGGHEDVAQELLEFGCRAELLLSAAERRMAGSAAGTGNNDGYLQQKIEYHGSEKLMDAEGEAVMMEWERPLMIAHAASICQTKGDVLNIGFGLGIVDGAIQEQGPRSHTIIEAHLDVYKKMIDDGWDKKEGVKVVFGRWQDVIDDLGPFDGIFFDTFGEHYEDMRGLHERLPKLLKPGGVYSFFNGLAPDNPFFQAVYAEIVKREMAQLGIETTFVPLPIDASSSATWTGVKHRYWWSDTYYLPMCQKMEGVEEDGE